VEIRLRQREGIAAAKQRGAYRGRRRSLTTTQVADLARRSAAGEPKTTLAREFGISRETVYQYLRATTTPLTPEINITSCDGPESGATLLSP
ncbi:MAG: helix-turn-helix domain-containing protein, partial [Pseudonocardiaceae bacterium]